MDSANLTALAMASPSEGWASGFTLANSPQNAPFEPLLAAWDGRRWRTIPVNIGMTAGGRLDGLAVRSAADAWAVGSVSPSASVVQPLILHWNGRRWVRIPAANVAGCQFASLLSVAAHSARDASVSLGPLSQKSTDLNAVAFDGRHAIWAVGSVSLSQRTFGLVVQVNR